MEKGKVIKLENNKITIRLASSDACKKCGGCVVNKQNQAILADVENTVNAKKGDTVVIDNKAKSVVISALIVYLLPVIALIGGYYLGLFVSLLIGFKRILPFVGAFSLFSLSIFIVWLIDKHLSKSSSFKPTIVRKI